ncbi:hypothetical protein L1887_02951 [Cichorium endivia]|nr:hypothetical protein L1887_02951 [Cichorium endivia]
MNLRMMHQFQLSYKENDDDGGFRLQQKRGGRSHVIAAERRTMMMVVRIIQHDDYNEFDLSLNNQYIASSSLEKTIDGSSLTVLHQYQCPNSLHKKLKLFKKVVIW